RVRPRQTRQQQSHDDNDRPHHWPSVKLILQHSDDDTGRPSAIQSLPGIWLIFIKTKTSYLTIVNAYPVISPLKKCLMEYAGLRRKARLAVSTAVRADTGNRRRYRP